MSMIDHVTSPAKLDIIATTQAEDNERHRVEVSRSFVCKCTTVIRMNRSMLILEHSGYCDRYAAFQAR
jgi:hypothetical protein